MSKIFPNHVIGDFTVILNNDRDQQLAVLQFINTQGEIIIEQEQILNIGETILPIDASQLNTGCYFLKVSINSQTELQKFIVQ